MTANRVRVLSEVLAIDAWHQPFRIDNSTVAVHVEMSFQEGRIGGDDPKFPFTFKIRLKKAVLSVSLESPLTIDRASIARGMPSEHGERTQTATVKQMGGRSMGASASLGIASQSAEISGALRQGSEKSNTEELKIIQSTPSIWVSAMPKGANEYCWHLEPGQKALKPYLDGQPWDPVLEPRLSAKLNDYPYLIDPSIKITASCALEDLDIFDLEPKDVGFIQHMKNGIFNSINVASAIQQLKLTLKDADLEFGHLDDRFSGIIIADLLAISE